MTVRNHILYNQCEDHWDLPQFGMPCIHLLFSDQNMLMQNFETYSQYFLFPLEVIYLIQIEGTFKNKRFTATHTLILIENWVNISGRVITKWSFAYAQFIVLVVCTTKTTLINRQN